MPESPLQAAGAQIDPSAAAPLHTNEWFTGMLTNGNPLGPGPVPYLYQKFYSANRYDRLVGGQNSEITMRSTLGRRFGHTAFNNMLGSAVKRMYLFNAVNTGGQNNRLLADAANADVYDLTAAEVLFTKAANAGRTCFQGVGNTCYMGDGVDLKKYMLAGKVWLANTVYRQGDLIIDSNGNIQIAETFATLSIQCVQVILVAGQYYALVTFNGIVPWAHGANITFGNLQGYIGLNGITAASTVPGGVTLNGNQACFEIAATSLYGPTTDAGSATSQVGATMGESGATQPTWGTYPHFTADGNIVWQCFGLSVFNWGISAPTLPPAVTRSASARSWQPNAVYVNASGGTVISTAIVDLNGNVELLVIPAATTVQSGPSIPVWSQLTPSAATAAGTTADGSASWYNGGPVRAWQPNTVYYAYQTILDPNGNLQVCSTPGTSGAAAPVWPTVLGNTVADNTVTWTCLGPGVALLTGVRQYAFAYHLISGQVSTLSPFAPLNPTGYTIGPQGLVFGTLNGIIPANRDIDQVWIFATVVDGSAPLLLARIPNLSPGTANAWVFYDEFPDAMLNAEIEGPQNDANDPPPPGFVPAAFHLGLVCGFVGNALFYSNGTTPVGNPNESFAPANYFQLPSTPVAAWSTALGLVVMRVDGFSVMLGSNTAASPLYVVNIFDGVGLAARDAFATRGNSVFMVTTTGKVMRFQTSQFLAAIQGASDGVSQALPEDEIGFPIGDLLGAFTPSDCYVAWYEGPSNDSGLFVSDGSTGWYMMRVLRTPDEAQPWSPKATLPFGVSSIYACETSPGINSLLVGLPTGPIWRRDQSTNADAGTSFAADAEVCPIVLSQPGNTVTVQFITTEEKKISGATRLKVGVLFDELSGTFRNLRNVTQDPPNLAASKTVGVQRFQAQQDAGTIPICRIMLQQISWGAQDYPNELFTNTIYGRLPARAHR